MLKKIEINDKERLLCENENQKLNRGNFLTNFTFAWVYPLLKKGSQKTLEQNDLLTIDNTNCTQTSYDKLNKNLKKDSKKSSDFKKAVYKSFKYQIIVCYIYYIIVILFQVCLPILTEYSQKYFMYDNEDQKPQINSMLIFVGLQFIYMILLSLIKPYQLFLQALLSIKIQGALQQQMLVKTLQFPLQRSKHFSTGELINMLQVDVTQASQYFQNKQILFTFPLQLGGACIIFYYTMNGEALIPLLGAICQAFFGFIFGYYYGIVQKKYMISKDQRMKQVDEALTFSKQIKLNCMEEFFQNRISKIRSVELKYLKYQIIMLLMIQLIQGSIGIGTWELWIMFTKTMSYSLMTLMTQNYQNVVTILGSLPIYIKNYQMSSNSIARISNYFIQNNCQPTKKGIQQSQYSIIVNNGIFDWKNNDHMKKEVIEEENYQESKQFTLQLEIQIKKGQFIAFVGNSASGKSTILKSLLGETNCIQGEVLINGVISLATQEPWILNDTIKQNITFMNEFEKDKYNNVLKICGLERDIKTFKYGDETMLGEKGDNLSGGQQKRINLARAIYNDADIYLLDDPLSALDIKVKYLIHQQCILGYLKNKTRILFTNSMANLQECDMIYIVENGQIIKSGKFQDLINKNEINVLIEKPLQKEQFDIQFENQYYCQNDNEQLQDMKGSLLQQEDQEKGQISKGVLDQVFTYLGRYWAILLTSTYVIVVVTAQLFGQSILANDSLSGEELRSLSIIFNPIIQASIIIPMILVNAYFQIKGLLTSKILHTNVIKSLLYASYTKFYNTILIGRLMNRLSKDIYNIDLLFPTSMKDFTIQATTLSLPLLGCLIYLNYISLPLIIVFFLIIVTVTNQYYKCLREVTRIESVSKSPVFSFFQQLIRGIIYTKQCLPQEQIIKKQQQNVDLDLSNQINLYGFQYWYQSLTGVITNIFQSLLFIVCFIFPGSAIKMTYLVLQQMQLVSQMLLSATISYGNVQMYLISFERCLHLANKIDLEINNITNNDQQKQYRNQSDQNENNQILKLLNCSFQYRPNSKIVLEDMSFDLHKFEKIGIVGRTGAGKSSIIMALTQLIEQVQGSIELNNQNINQYSLHQLRSQFSIIPQDPLVFYGTLKENLDPFNQFSESIILQFAQICRLFEMQSFKQNGLQTEITNLGSNLSAGEKQLLNITRCLIENKSIILIDEATANIDTETEEYLKDIFEKHFKNKTMITIAHKITTILNSDRIMVLNDGKISEFDHPKSLLNNPKSEFKQILNLIQMSEQL